jgi:hypothetical protein
VINAATTQAGHKLQALLRDAQHWPGPGDRHDDDDEHGLSEIHPVSDIIENRGPTFEIGDRASQHENPDAKHRFDFPEEMQDLPLETHLIRLSVGILVGTFRGLHAPARTRAPSGEI